MSLNNNIKGFTLLELIAAMSILVILTLLVLPSMYSRMQKSNEDVATQILLKNGQFLEKWYGEYGYYGVSSTSNLCPNLPYRFSPESDTALYLISGSGTSGSSCDNQYVLIARPICGTTQESLGCICLDQDSNIMRSANLNCNNGGGLCTCIARDSIPSAVTNAFVTKFGS